MILPRRSFLRGMVGLVAAPAVVKATSLMRISAPPLVMSRYERGLAASFAQTKEIFAANVLNYPGRYLGLAPLKIEGQKFFGHEWAEEYDEYFAA